MALLYNISLLTIFFFYIRSSSFSCQFFFKIWVLVNFTTACYCHMQVLQWKFSLNTHWSLWTPWIIMAFKRPGHCTVNWNVSTIKLVFGVNEVAQRAMFIFCYFDKCANLYSREIIWLFGDSTTKCQLCMPQIWKDYKERKRRGKWLRDRDAFQSCFLKQNMEKTTTRNTAGLRVGY